MGTQKMGFMLGFLGFLLMNGLVHCMASTVHRYNFTVEETSYTRLCSTKNILTVNGQFPGPTIYARQGDTVIVDVYNKGNKNITIHWHGVKQPRNPWSDGPEYITQCPLKPGANFTQTIILSDEEGTIWWHAHTEFDRATVHGPIVIYPKEGNDYPFEKPDAEQTIVIGEWWKEDIAEVYDAMVASGGDPNESAAYVINGQPGDLYPCSKPGTYKLLVDYGKTYLLRIINSAMQDIHFFKIANHNLTVVGTDGAYTKQFTSDYLSISPGQTLDVLLHANQTPGEYYMAARVYNGNTANVAIQNSTTTAIVKYNGNYSSSTPLLPILPWYNDTSATVSFNDQLKSLADEDHPISVPQTISKQLFYTISINTLPCDSNTTCGGPDGLRLAASVNNESFVNPTIAILEAYYSGINGVFGIDFPKFPPQVFDWTADNLSSTLWTPKQSTLVKVLKFNSTVEIVFQNTNLVAGTDHPMHLHGYSFYVVGSGPGNFNSTEDPKHYNLVDPPLVNTVALPFNRWIAIRFRADNPGVWFMHCHLDRHAAWGMDTVFIVRNGKGSNEKILSPPNNMPPC